MKKGMTDPLTLSPLIQDDQTIEILTIITEKKRRTMNLIFIATMMKKDDAKRKRTNGIRLSSVPLLIRLHSAFPPFLVILTILRHVSF